MQLHLLVSKLVLSQKGITLIRQGGVMVQQNNPQHEKKAIEAFLRPLSACAQAKKRIKGAITRLSKEVKNAILALREGFKPEEKLIRRVKASMIVRDLSQTMMEAREIAKEVSTMCSRRLYRLLVVEALGGK